jgi:hypothetical protein
LRTRKQNFPGRLRPSDVAKLPLEVQRARAAYLQDTSVELGQLFGQVGVVAEHDDDLNPTVSLNSMMERGYQVDTDGHVYEPSPEREGD